MKLCSGKDGIQPFRTPGPPVTLACERACARVRVCARNCARIVAHISSYNPKKRALKNINI